MRVSAAIANSAWWLASLPEARRFRHAMADVEGAQRARLAHLLQVNAGTAYGRRLGFAGIRSYEEYRASVPLVTYDDLRLDIERMAAGEPDILLPGRPASFVPTSGSTAATKLIPWTPAVRAEFQAGIAPWVADIFRASPALLGGPAYWSISPVTWQQRVTSGGIPIGVDDDADYLHPGIARLLGQVMAVPATVARVPEMPAVRYLTLAWLLRARELRLISVWNPAFLTLLLEPLEGWAEALLRDLADGTLSPPGQTPAETLASLRAGWRADRSRAREVARALTHSERAERLAGLWPRLALISCWTAAAAAGPARELARLFPRVAMAGKGLLATEGIISIPLHGHSGCAAALRAHVLEFLPVQGGEPRPAWEVERGGCYEVVLTTGGGLYRYRLGDLVNVVGHVGACPLLDFVGRVNAVVDCYGEKLHEAHVNCAINEAGKATGVEIAFALLAPEGKAPASHYTLFFVSGKPIAAGRLARLAGALDDELCENVHYAYCRRLGQLQAVKLCLLPISVAAAEECVSRIARVRGLRAGDIKPVVLDGDLHWRARFDGMIQA